MTTRTRDAEQLEPARHALFGHEMIMAEDEARTARQSSQRVFQHRVVAFVGEQPQVRQVPSTGLRTGLARAHPLAIARRMESAATLLAAVEERIARACQVARRPRGEVTLVAVSKTQPGEAIVPLIEAGQRVFGENRVQEAQAKWPALRERHPQVELHLVGQLQSNKAEEAVALFDAVHSLDRPSLVAALARAMDKAGRRMPCFVQVNIGAEAQKGGAAIAGLPALLADARAAEIPLAGLMCVPPLGIEPAPFFALLDKLARDHGLQGRSMGMSGDFETAIMLGATHVRVGTALFGERA
jgi:pyridoxal phosphate enzyme (YggS family)